MSVATSAIVALEIKVDDESIAPVVSEEPPVVSEATPVESPALVDDSEPPETFVDESEPTTALVELPPTTVEAVDPSLPVVVVEVTVSPDEVVVTRTHTSAGGTYATVGLNAGRSAPNEY